VKVFLDKSPRFFDRINDHCEGRMSAAQLNTMRVLPREKNAEEVKFWISTGDNT
jgi:hypothetical protein